MTETDLYKLLTYNKRKFTRQEYLTLKGQIKKKDYAGAYKGIITCIGRRKSQNEIRNNR